MKKAFALFLTIAIALTLLPTAALAAGEWHEEISGLETSSKYIGTEKLKYTTVYRYSLGTSFRVEKSIATPYGSAGRFVIYDYICALYHLGIVNGTSATNFSPYDTLTREQAATILIRAADVLGINAPDVDIPFTDNISSWAVNGVRRAYGAKLMNGYSATEFGAKDAYTSEQALITVYRLYQAANK